MYSVIHSMNGWNLMYISSWRSCTRKYFWRFQSFGLQTFFLQHWAEKIIWKNLMLDIEQSMQTHKLHNSNFIYFVYRESYSCVFFIAKGWFIDIVILWLFFIFIWSWEWLCNMFKDMLSSHVCVVFFLKQTLLCTSKNTNMGYDITPNFRWDKV